VYFGLAISFALHVGLLAWAVASFHSTSELPRADSPTIEAELVSLSEFTRLKQGDPKAQELEAKEQENPEPQISKKEAPKPKPELVEPPPASEPPPAPEPEKTEPAKAETPPPAPDRADPIAEQIASLPPEPSPEELALKQAAEQKAKAEAEAKREAERKAKAEAERKKKEAERKKKEAERKRKEAARKKQLAEEKRLQEAKNKKSFADQMAALIDKTPEERGSPRSGQAPRRPTDYEGPTAGEREGSGNELTAREADLLKGQISAQLRNCWRLPGGGGGIESVVVTVRWRLREDGSLDGPPEIQNGRSDPVFQAAARSALAAVTECAPFNLPPDRYTAWRTIIWDFDPRHML